MATLKSKKLHEALKKARNVGRAEESVVVDGCSLVLRSLAPKDYESIVGETEELEGIEYFQGYQMGHVCRSIVEIEGVDLREVDFVEDDVPSGHYVISAACSKSKAEEAKEALLGLGINLAVVPPDGSEGDRTVLVERHEWVRQRASTWSREAIGVLYRKFADVVTEGERRAREKVEFRVADETDEDKFRRLLGEMKEASGSLPQDLTQKILGDAGYMPKSTPAELEEATRRAREFAIEQARLKDEAAEEAPLVPVVVASPPAPTYSPPLPPEVPTPTTPQDLQQELMERLRNRVPMNRAAMQVPVPSSDLVQPSPAGVPPQIQSAMAESRAAQIAALEGNVDPQLVAHEPQVFPPQRETPELSRHIPQIDGKGVKTIIDQRPVVGLNPRFRRPQ